MEEDLAYVWFVWTSYNLKADECVSSQRVTMVSPVVLATLILTLWKCLLNSSNRFVGFVLFKTGKYRTYIHSVRFEIRVIQTGYSSRWLRTQLHIQQRWKHHLTINTKGILYVLQENQRTSIQCQEHTAPGKSVKKLNGHLRMTTKQVSLHKASYTNAQLYSKNKYTLVYSSFVLETGLFFI